MTAAALALGLALTWAAHAVLLFLPDSVVLALLARRSSGWVWGVLMAALIPQLFVIPWAWRDSSSARLGHLGRILWRTGFLCLGFLAVTPYVLLRRRREADRDHAGVA
jgi:hypothetical protein